jgi:predicted anti-sigma-YlaC factor YlaD
MSGNQMVRYQVKLTCKQAAELLSESQDRKLSVPERLTLRMHLAVCQGCRDYGDQLAFMRRAFRAYLRRD